MEVELAAGISIDLATGDDLRNAIRDLKGAMVLPLIPRRLYRAAVIPVGFTGAPQVIEVDAPKSSVVWDLRHLVICGSDDHTLVANVAAAVYVGQGAAGSVSLMDVVWTGLAVPGQEKWNKEIFVGHNEQLYVQLAGSGLAAGQVYVVTAEVVEVQADCIGAYLR